MFRKIASLFGFVPASVISSAPAPAAREHSAEELKVKIRHALNSPKYKFRTLKALSRVTGLGYGETHRLIQDMPDVRPARRNADREYDKALFTFANAG